MAVVFLLMAAPGDRILQAKFIILAVGYYVVIYIRIRMSEWR